MARFDRSGEADQPRRRKPGRAQARYGRKRNVDTPPPLTKQHPLVAKAKDRPLELGEVGVVANVDAPNVLHPSLRKANADSVLTPSQQLQVASLAVGAVPAATTAVKNLGNLDPGEATNVIAGFGDTGKLTKPTQQAERIVKANLVAKAQARGNDTPANASATDLYRAAYGDGGKPSWANLLNPAVWAKDIALTPLYTAQGGYALGAAAAAAAKGNTEPIKEIGRQTIEPLTSRDAAKRFITEHPFQTVLAGAGGIKGAGAIEGRVRGLSSEPRIIDLASLPETDTGRPFLDRGQYSTNANTRRLQQARDRATANLPGVEVGNSRILSPAERALNRQSRRFAHQERMRAAHEAAEIARPVADAQKRLKPRRGRGRAAESILYNQGTGATPSESLRFYEGQDGEAAAAHARLRQEQINRYGDTLDDPGSAFLDAAREGARARTNQLVGEGVLNPYTAKRREYHPLIQRLAAEGDATAQRFLDLEAAHRDIETQVRGLPAATRRARMNEAKLRERRNALGPVNDARTRELEGRLSDVPTRDSLQEHIDAVREDLQATLDEIAQQHAEAGGPEPFRVPFPRAGENPRRMAGSKNLRLSTIPSKLGLNVANPRKPYTGEAYRTGRYTPDANEFVRQLQAPSHALASRRYTLRLSDPENGLVTRAAPGAETPDGYVAVNRDNLRKTVEPDNQDAEMVDQRAEQTRVGRDIEDSFHPAGTVVPERGDWVWMPDSLHAHITRTVAPATGLDRAFGAVGKFLTQSMLNTRPAYPLQNLVGGLEQATILGGAGPASLVRAARRSVPEIQGTRDQGFIAATTRPASPGNPIPAYTNTIRSLAIGADNYTRAATQAAHMVREARNIAHPDRNVFQRAIAAVHSIDADTRKVMEQIANGEHPEAATRILETINNAHGDFSAMASAPWANAIFPWNRWPRFVARLLTTTLPAHYPGRALAIYQLGDIGQQAQNQIGAALPPWMQGIFPTSNQGYLSTGSSETFGSLGSYFPPDTTTPNNRIDFSDALFSNPLFRSAALVATGRDPVSGHIATDPYGRAVRASDPTYAPDPNSASDTARLAASELLNLFWPLRLIDSPNPADTSVPLPGLTQDRVKQSKGGPRPHAGPAIQLFNAISPIKYRVADIPAEAQRGAEKLRDNLKKAQKAVQRAELSRMTLEQKIEYWKARAPKDAADTQRYAELMSELMNHPDELDRILKEGTRGG